MKKRATLVSCFLVACSQSDFASTTKTRPAPVVVDNVAGIDLPGSVAMEQCQASFDYNPQEILCRIPFSSVDTIWHDSSVWLSRFNGVNDSSAEIISPLQHVLYAGTNKLMCGLVPGSDVLVYVSYLDVPIAGEFRVDNMVDDEGTVRFWKGGDPRNEITVSGNTTDIPVNLEAGHYAIVIDVLDTGAVTNGMGMTVRNSISGDVVRRSSGSGEDWCIFRTNHSGLNLSEFVPAAGKCRKCFEGTGN